MKFIKRRAVKAAGVRGDYVRYSCQGAGTEAKMATNHSNTNDSLMNLHHCITDIIYTCDIFGGGECLSTKPNTCYG